jgi:ABC-type lipoprotein export system ATPase subunit
MLEINNLTAGYEDKAVVTLPKFSLATGEHCLILGASGSGKTTLLYAIAGLLEPMSGEIMLEGTSVTQLKGEARDRFRGQHIGIIYQTLHMVAALSALKNLTLAQYAAGVVQDEKKALGLLTQLGLEQHKDKKPTALSQGQQQRLSVARAAINSPVLILGDEPTSALDDAACKTTMELLLAAAKISNASLLVATHDARIKPYFKKTVTL